ncbi:MAG: hypothetical protein ACRDRY_02490 [Pseudonocardiaceae bacterium]
MSAANRPVPRVPDAPHGTLRGFQMGCGCMWCRSAKRAAIPAVSGAATSEVRTTR